MQQNIFKTSWPTAGADFSIHLGSILGSKAPEKFFEGSRLNTPLVFQNFLEKAGGISSVIT